MREMEINQNDKTMLLRYEFLPSRVRLTIPFSIILAHNQSCYWYLQKTSRSTAEYRVSEVRIFWKSTRTFYCSVFFVNLATEGSTAGQSANNNTFFLCF